MNDLLSAVLSVLVLFIGSLMVGGILYILVKNYVKCKIQNGK